MTQTFKVGDTVRRLTSFGAGDTSFPAGSVWVVQAVRSGGTEIELAHRPYNPDNGWWCSEFFELVEAAAPKVRALKGDNKLVFQALADGLTWSVQELEQYIRSHSDRKPTAATITARIRDLRKTIYGGFKIERIQSGKLHFYKLVQG